MNGSGGETRIVVVGGGPAGIEAMLALRHQGGDRARLTLVSAKDEFVLKPLSVLEPFGQGEALRYDLRSLASAAGAGLERQNAARVDPRHRTIFLRDGTELTYDYLVIAVGTKPLWTVPGATTFWGVAGEQGMDEVLGRLETGESEHVAFALPRGAWPLPAYELALKTASELVHRGLSDRRLSIVSEEPGPLAAFGPDASREMAALLEINRIEFVGETESIGFDGRELMTSGGPYPADDVIVLPRLAGRRIDGIPCDEEGFIPVDGFGRVQGIENAFAAGDVTTSPIKYGGVATGQADTIAATIAANVWGAPPPAPFRPAYRPVVMTGAGPIALAGGGGAEHGLSEGQADRPSTKIFGRYLTPFLESLSAK